MENQTNDPETGPRQDRGGFLTTGVIGAGVAAVVLPATATAQTGAASGTYQPTGFPAPGLGSVREAILPLQMSEEPIVTTAQPVYVLPPGALFGLWPEALIADRAYSSAKHPRYPGRRCLTVRQRRVSGGARTEPCLVGSSAAPRDATAPEGVELQPRSDVEKKNRRRVQSRAETRASSCGLRHCAGSGSTARARDLYTGRYDALSAWHSQRLRLHRRSAAGPVDSTGARAVGARPRSSGTGIGRHPARCTGELRYATNYLIDTDHAIIVDVETTREVRQAETGAARAMIDRASDRWLENASGLQLELRSRREGPALSLYPGPQGKEDLG